MATPNLKRLMSESTLFSEDSTELDYSKLTEEQRIALQRQGRTDRVQSGSKKKSIGLGGTAFSDAVFDKAGGELASGNTLIVPNVQRTKAFRQDDRSRGGNPIATASPRGTNQSQSVSPGLSRTAAVSSVGGVGSSALKQVAGMVKGMVKSNYGDSGPVVRNADGMPNPAINAAGNPFLNPTEDQWLFGNPPERMRELDILNNPGHTPTPAPTGMTGGQMAQAGVGTVATAAGMANQVMSTKSLLEGKNIDPMGTVGNTVGTTLAAQSAATAFGAGTSTASGVMSGVMGGVAKAAPAVGFALMAANNLSQIYKSKAISGREEPKQMSPGQLMQAKEGGLTSLDTGKGGQELEFAEEDGVKYVKDPYAKNNYGRDQWHALDDKNYAKWGGQVKKTEQKRFVSGLGGRDEKMAWQSGPNELRERMSADETSDYKGIKGAYKGFRSEFDELNEEDMK